MSKIELIYETPSSLPVKRIKVPGGWLYKWGSNDSSPVFVAEIDDEDEDIDWGVG